MMIKNLFKISLFNWENVNVLIIFDIAHYIWYYPYPAGTQSDKPLSYTVQTVQSQQALYCWLAHFKYLSWFPQIW